MNGPSPRSACVGEDRVRVHADLTILVELRLRARGDASRAARGVVNPDAETFAAFDRRQPVPQGLLASYAIRGTVLGTRRRAREPFWRGGRFPGKTRSRCYDLPCFHHRASPAVLLAVSADPASRTIALGTRSGDRSDRPGLPWSGCHPLAGCSDGVGHRSQTRAAATRDHESAHRAYALADCVPSAS
jgi:hypothetical protein